MITVSQLMANLSTLDPNETVDLTSSCPTPPSSPPSPPSDGHTPFSWIPKEWEQDNAIVSIRNSFYVQMAGSLDHSDPFKVTRKLSGLVRLMNAKIALYIACKYGDAGIRRMPYEVRSMLQDQDMGSIGWGPVD